MGSCFKGVGVAQTAALSGLRPCVLDCELPRTCQKRPVRARGSYFAEEAIRTIRFTFFSRTGVKPLLLRILFPSRLKNFEKSENIPNSGDCESVCRSKFKTVKEKVWQNKSRDSKRRR